MRKNLDELIPKLIKNNYMILGTDVTNGIPLKDIKIPKKYAIVIGNEGQGISKNIKELITKNIYIPMSCKNGIYYSIECFRVFHIYNNITVSIYPL